MCRIRVRQRVVESAVLSGSAETADATTSDFPVRRDQTDNQTTPIPIGKNSVDISPAKNEKGRRIPDILKHGNMYDGTFTGLATGFNLYNSGTDDGDNVNNLYFNNLAIIPEPSSAAARGAALARRLVLSAAPAHCLTSGGDNRSADFAETNSVTVAVGPAADR